MVIVLFVAGFHALAIAIALADVDGIPEADTGNRPWVCNRDVRTELLFRLRLQPCENFLFVVIGEFLVVLLQELINGNVLRYHQQRRKCFPKCGQPQRSPGRFQYRATSRRLVQNWKQRLSVIRCRCGSCAGGFDLWSMF